MASNYLLDTNIASYAIEGTIPTVLSQMALTPINQVFISSVTEGELRYGVARRLGATRLQQVVEEFLVSVRVLPWNSDAARAYGDLRADLERVGQPMGTFDTMIGAHALAIGAILVSNDHAFTRIKGLRVEDWTVSP